MSQAATAERTTDSQRPASGISLRVVANAVRRHPVAFLGVILLAAAVASGIWFFLPLPKKTAAVVFHVSSQPRAPVGSGPSTAADFASYKQSQMALIKSRRTFNSALSGEVKIDDVQKVRIKDLEIIRSAEPDDMTWLDKHVMVESKTGSEFVRVTIEGDNGDELLTLLKAITSSYIALTTDRDAKNKARLIENIALIEKELETKRTEINKLAEFVGGKGASYQTLTDKIRMDAVVKASEDVAAIQLEVDTIAADLVAAKLHLLAVRPTVVMAVTGSFWVELPQAVALRTDRFLALAVQEALRQDRRLQELEEEVTRAKETFRKTQDSFQPGVVNAQIEKAKSNVKVAEEDRDAYRRDAESRLYATLKERSAEVAEGMVNKLNADHERAKIKLLRAQTRLKTLEDLIFTTNRHRTALEDLQLEIAHKTKLHAAMNEELERMRIEQKAPRVETAEEPYLINGIEGNRRLKYALMAGLGALMLGFGGLVMWEYRSRRVTRTEEVTSDLGARLIGTIPPLVATNGVGAPDEANTPLVEAIDTTRIMLTHASADGSKLRVLMVTSAVSGEGKTTLSGNLAISLTRAGFRTLLIDGDMQAPSAHLLFDLPDAPGLSELLRGDTSLARAVQSTPIPGLSVLPAGRWNMTTRQSLVGDRWRLLKQQLETEFDFVVIDTSPLLMVSDAMLLAREADGVVLSVLLGVSQIARVAETVNRLHAIGAELAGVVVNNVQSEVYRRYMARAKYAVPPPVVADENEGVVASEDETGVQEAMAEEIGLETAANTKEGS